MIKKKELIEEAKKLNPDIRIGKAGLTEGMINEIKLQLKVKKLVKVKMLKPAFEEIGKKKLAMEIAEKTEIISMGMYFFSSEFHGKSI